ITPTKQPKILPHVPNCCTPRASGKGRLHVAIALPAVVPSALSSGSSSAVERQLPKLDVAGSIPVSRSIFQTLTEAKTELWFKRVQFDCTLRNRPTSCPPRSGCPHKRFLR